MPNIMLSQISDDKKENFEVELSFLKEELNK